MNKWTQRSFEICSDNRYLYNLHDIYPMSDHRTVKLDATTKNDLKIAFEKKDDALLLKMLLHVKKFPTKGCYKQNEIDLIIESNPKTVARIANRIYSIGFDKMILGIEEPIKTNRQMGQMFPNWIRSKYTCYTSQEAFFNSKDSISVLAGNDIFLADFVKKYLNVSLPKYAWGDERGLDAVVKLNTSPTPTFVIGEARFISDRGGMQYVLLKDPLHLLTSKDFCNESDFNIIRIAILDGACWLSDAGKMQRDIKALNDNQIAISALLLDDFFTDLLK